MWKIEKSEAIAIGSLIAFAGIWIFLLVPHFISSSWFQNLIPPLQYVVYNIGSILIVSVVMGLPISKAMNKEFKLKSMIRGGIMSWLVFSFVLDMYAPPFAYGPSGTVLITEPDALPGTAVDRVVGWIWNYVGISDGFLYIFVYVITPIIAVIIAALLFKPKMFMKILMK